MHFGCRTALHQLFKLYIFCEKRIKWKIRRIVVSTKLNKLGLYRFLRSRKPKSEKAKEISS